MKLHSAAAHFNRMRCADAYTGVFLFKGQLSLFDDSKKDTEGGERRILELSPSVALPTRRVVEAEGVRYILGHGYKDSALGRTIRVKYVAHEATALGRVRSLEQVCLGAAGVEAYAARAWVKDSKEISESSDMVGVNHFHLSSTENLNVNDTILFESQLHIVRKITRGAAGTLIATCDEIQDSAVESATLNLKTFDPVTELSSVTVVPLTVVRVRWQSLFEYKGQIEDSFSPGESQVVISKSVTTPLVGSTFTLVDGTHQVMSILDKPGVWVCRVSSRV